MYEKDELIITKYDATRLGTLCLHSNLDLISIHPDVITYISPRNHVPLCLLFAYKRGRQA